MITCYELDIGVIPCDTNHVVSQSPRGTVEKSYKVAGPCRKFSRGSLFGINLLTAVWESHALSKESPKNPNLSNRKLFWYHSKFFLEAYVEK